MATMNWEALSPDIDLSHGSTCSILKDNVIVIGGNSGQQNILCPSTSLRVASFSLKKLEWELVHVNSNGIANRRNHATATVGDSVVVFGGVHTKGGNMLIGDLVTCTPTPFGVKCVRTEAPSMARMGHSANTFGDGQRAVVFGGKTDEGCPAEAWIYVPKSGAWIEVELDPANVAAPLGRYHHSAVVCGDQNQFLVVSGGVVVGAETGLPAASSEVWVLDLTAFVVDAPPEDVEAPVVDKGKKPAKGAPAGPVKPVATWSLAAPAEDAAPECTFMHTTYKAAQAGAGASFRVGLLGGMSFTQPPASVCTHRLLELSRTPSGEFSVRVSATVGGTAAGATDSSFGCNFVPIAEPAPAAAAAAAAEEGAAKSPRNPASLIVPSAVPVAVLALNQSTVNLLELQDTRSGSPHRSRDHGHHSHGSIKSLPHKQSRELQATNTSAGVRLWALDEAAQAPLVAALRAQVVENARQAVLRANRGRDPAADADLEDRWTGLFRGLRVELGGDGDFYEGDVVYREASGDTITLDSRPTEKDAELALIARLSDPAGCGLDVVRHGAGSLVRGAERSELSGSWVDGAVCGAGLLVNRSSGLVYRGGFEAGLFSGMGKLYYGGPGPARELYDGEFRAGKRSGAGRLYTVVVTDNYQHNNNVGLDIIDNVPSTSYDVRLSMAYDGDWADDAMSGHGTCVLPDGSTYTGCLLNNLPNGNDGICVYGDGSKYTGQWRGGRRNGLGVYTTARDETYEGKWVNDQRCGRGVWRSQLTGESYDGNWERHLPNGQGKRVYADRSIYTGAFADGLRQGVGTMVYQGGAPSPSAASPGARAKGKGKDAGPVEPTSTYTGQWYKNLRHGEGKWMVVGAVGSGSAGQSSEASLNANTSMSTIASGDIPIAGNGSTNKPLAVDAEISYEGEWHSDKRNGKGFALHQSGKTSSGIFENDYLRD